MNLRPGLVDLSRRKCSEYTYLVSASGSILTKYQSPFPSALRDLYVDQFRPFEDSQSPEAADREMGVLLHCDTQFLEGL